MLLANHRAMVARAEARGIPHWMRPFWPPPAWPLELPAVVGKIVGPPAAPTRGRLVSLEALGADEMATHITFVCPSGAHTVRRRVVKLLEPGGVMCSHCAHTGKPLTIEEMQELARSRGGICLSERCVNGATHLRWKCSFEHEWLATPNNVKNFGSWCPTCSTPGDKEECVRMVFHHLFPGHAFTRVRPAWLGGLELDGFNKELGIAFEYDGVQHARFDPFFHRTPTAFAEQQARDQIKEDVCIKVGVRLVRVPHTVSYEQMEAFIRERLLILDIVPDAGIAPGGGDLELRARASGARGVANTARLKAAAEKKGGALLSPGYLGYMAKHLLGARVRVEPRQHPQQRSLVFRVWWYKEEGR